MDKENIRNEIDAIDDKIVDLYLKRFECVKKVAEVKQQENLPVSDPAREREILNRLSLAAGPEYENEIAMLFSTLFSLSRAYQMPCDYLR